MKATKTKFRIRVLERAYKRGKNDYAEMQGDIEFRAGNFWVQFDGIGNCERLASFNLNRCIIFLK